MTETSPDANRAKVGETSATDRVSPALDANWFADDVALGEAVEREGAEPDGEALSHHGAFYASDDVETHARLADREPPQLTRHDASGRPVDRLDLHPGHTVLLAAGAQAGLGASLWAPVAAGDMPQAGAHVARAATLYLAAQADPAHLPALSASYAALPTLLLAPDIAQDWLAVLTAPAHDARPLTIAHKRAARLAVAVSEPEAGTELPAITTQAAPAADGGGDRRFRVTGRKWLAAGADADALLVLARTPGGLSCLLVPRFEDSGTDNAVTITDLHRVAGLRGCALAHLRFHSSLGHLVGEEGRGIAALAETFTALRLDSAVITAGMMRRAAREAIRQARARSIRGRSLARQPIHREVLADLVLDSEAAAVLVMRLARASDHASDARAQAWRRIMTPAARFWICRTAPAHLAEAVECVGGPALVAGDALARLTGAVPALGLWAGSSNAMAVDLLRALQKEPEAVDVVFEELEAAAGDDGHIAAGITRARGLLHEPRLIEARARALLESLALLASAVILRSHAPRAVADAFIGTRLAGVPRQCYGQGLEWVDCEAILARALPEA